MTDKIHPSSKPTPPPPPPPPMNGAAPKPTAAGAGSNSLGAGANPQQLTAAKSHLYNPNRLRPQPRRSGRRCSGRRLCCLCFIYALILILSFLLLAAIAASVFYVLYHPKHPTFSVSSVRISAFNLSVPGDPSSAGFSHLRSSMDFTLSAKNPNNKISFLYDPFAVAVASSGGLFVGNASLPAFTHAPMNTTILRGAVTGDPTRDLDSDSVRELRSDLGKKGGFPLSVQVDTKVQVKMGKLSSKKVGIRVSCDGIRGFPPKRSSSGRKTSPTLGSTYGAKCKVDLRIKIWIFTF